VDLGLINGDRERHMRRPKATWFWLSILSQHSPLSPQTNPLPPIPEFWYPRRSDMEHDQHYCVADFSWGIADAVCPCGAGKLIDGI
jgi:hypothetical protein